MPSLHILRALAASLEGELWKPIIVVQQWDDGWYWRDRAKGCVDSGGPFESEEAALLDVLRLYGVEDDSLPTTKENEDANP